MPPAMLPRRLPWQLILTVGLRIAQEGRRRWDRLSQRDQREVVRMVRKSRGRRSNLTERERMALRRLVWKAVGPRQR
jgi:hypothetical protein